MRFLKNIFDSLEPKFKDGGFLERLYPVFEATETILFSTDAQTSSHGPHIRDSIDIKRVMILVVVALIPCYFFGAINIGYLNAKALNIPRGMFSNFLFGMKYVLPVLLITFATGAFWELFFPIIRRHEVTESFLVTCALIPLTMPPDTPLWMVAAGTSFGVVLGKEVFGGTGMNIFNPALTARAFVYFAYPTAISGDKVWAIGPDGYSGATALSIPAAAVNADSVNLLNNVTQFDYSWWNMFIGFIPGSVGETSKILILLGACFLIITKIASWRTMLASVVGLFSTAFLFNILAPFSSNSMLTIPPHYHLVMGGFLFGAVFMATEPVTGPHTDRGKWIYGFMIGFLTIVIRSINPAYPEGVMLAILLMNAFASFIDYFVVQKNIKHRMARYAK